MKRLRSTYSMSPVAPLLFLTTTATAQRTGSTEATRTVVERYLDSNHADLSMITDDVVFINVATGDRHVGPDEVREMLHFVYSVALDAHAEQRNLIVEGSPNDECRLSNGCT